MKAMKRSLAPIAVVAVRRSGWSGARDRARRPNLAARLLLKSVDYQMGANLNYGLQIMQNQIELPLKTISLSKTDQRIFVLCAVSMTIARSERIAVTSWPGSSRLRGGDFVHSPSRRLNRLEAGRAFSPLIVAVRFIRELSARVAVSLFRVPPTRPREVFRVAVAVRSFLEFNAVNVTEYAACVN
jgi:hypothetical protein